MSRRSRASACARSPSSASSSPLCLPYGCGTEDRARGLDLRRCRAGFLIGSAGGPPRAAAEDRARCGRSAPGGGADRPGRRRALPEGDHPRRGADSPRARLSGHAVALAARTGRRDRAQADRAAGTRRLLAARGERRLVRQSRPGRLADRHHRRRRGRLPLLLGRLRVPPARELRRAERGRARQERDGDDAARERTRRSRRPRGRGRGRLGVLLRLRRRARAVDERVRAGRGGAIVRARREGRHGRLGTAAGGRALGVPRGARPARA